MTGTSPSEPFQQIRWTVGTRVDPRRYGPFLTFDDAQMMVERNDARLTIFEAVTTYTPVQSGHSGTVSDD